MVAGHHHLAAHQTDDSFVRQQNILHKLCFGSVSPTAIAKEMFCAGSDTFMQISSVLNAVYKGDSHCRR